MTGVGPDAAASTQETPAAEPPANAVTRRRFDPVRFAERYGLVLLWVVVAVVFAVVAPTSFPTIANFSTIFGTQAVLLVIALGLLVSLSVGEFDLSVAATMGFATVVVALLSAQDHWPLLAAIAVTLVVGLAVGGLNALLVVRGGISSFVVTLGTGTLLTGLGYGLSNSETIGGIPSGLITAASKQFLDLPLAFYYGLALTLALWYVFNYVPLGRHLVFVGEGREVARLSGLRVQRIRAGALITCSVIATVAGILQAGVVGAADPSGGPTFLLPAFASAFLGATAIRPGRFNAWGTFVAVYFLVTGITGLQLLGYTGWIQDVWYGGSLVVAVAVARFAEVRRRATTGA
ncbi:MAG TPA: ABC transporter permease [Streptosporangiaceae bacterium]|nr:ABC transporter permease [Streptosporangiaceae bacterium]